MEDTMHKQLIEKINELRREKKALILAHNYQPVEIQELADITGDSLQLSIAARETKASIIVFCGVMFMAETASMLNPEAKVLIPAIDAGCPMADMVTAEHLRDFKAHHPGLTVVCYVNSTAEVKAESDICCTSSNAVKVLRSLPEDSKILFVPDQNLGAWAAKQSGREVILWDGYCPVHQWGFEATHVRNMRRKHPDHVLLAHPECDEDIIELADEVMSTGGMIKYVREHDNVILATEKTLTAYLKHLYPEKSLIPLNAIAICKNMRKITLELLAASLENEQYHVRVPEDIALKAVRSLQRMLELSN
jgi:quinolinate synthase